MNTGSSITLWQILGPIGGTVAGIATLSLLALFILGIFNRARSRPVDAVSWWLRSVSLTALVFGVAFAACHLARLHLIIAKGVIGNMQPYNQDLGEAFLKLATFAIISTGGLVAMLILGRPKDRRRQQSVGGDSVKAADGLTGAPQR